VREKQIARLQKIRQQRDPVKAEEAKRLLYKAYSNKENIMPALIEAAKAYLSAGEIAEIERQAGRKEEVYHLSFLCG
jgi:methylmalonyl-CoA mutase N-terminal domain/subunit